MDYKKKYLKYKLKYLNAQKILGGSGQPPGFYNSDPRRASPLSPLPHGDNSIVAPKQIKFENGVYEGDIAFNIPQGYGVMNYNNNDKYEGQFCNGYPHGQGVMIYANKDKYQGQFYNGCQHGQGVMNYNNHNIYIGSWLNGKKHGYGTLQERKIIINEHTGKPEINPDTGEISLSIFSTYQGKWMDDKKHGRGNINYNNGEHIYNGMWQNDIKHGKGIQENNDPMVKRKIEGIWDRGSYFNNPIIITHSLPHEGYKLDGTPTQNTCMKPGYINNEGRRHGIFTATMLDGSSEPRIVTYDDGVLLDIKRAPPSTIKKK